MANAVATRPDKAPARRPTVKDLFLSASTQQSLRDVLPKHLTADRLAKIALVEISKNPSLAKCNPMSLLKCLMQSAELGLEFGGVLGQAYMVPYKAEATFIVGYRGLITLARRSGEIAQIAAYCVYRGEPFKVTAGLDGAIQHEIDYSVERTAQNVVAAYAVAKLKDGSRHFEVMSRGEIDAIRNRSRAGSNGPWVTDYAEMAKKTVVRRLAKYLPLSPEDPMAKAMAVDGDRIADDTSATATADLNAMLTADETDQGQPDDTSEVVDGEATDVTPADDTPPDEPDEAEERHDLVIALANKCNVELTDAHLVLTQWMGKSKKFSGKSLADLTTFDVKEIAAKIESGTISA